MIEAAAVVVCVGIYFLTLAKGQATPAFDWVKFWACLGMFVVFFFGFALPLCFAYTFQARHPLLFFTLMLGGILVFVLAVTTWGLKRKKMRAAL